jgi:Transcriptional regulators
MSSVVPASDPPPPLSIRKLADLLGASRSTVSRAFREDASVRPELRARILAEAEKHGYRRDPLVSELMTSFARRQPVGYRETLGVLWWPERWEQSGREDTFGGRLRRGLERAAERHGCRLTQFVLRQRTTGALTRTLLARGIRGLVITPPSEPGQAVPGLDWENFSAVVIGRSLAEHGFDRVHHNHYAAMVEVLRRLKERGFGRPVLLADVNLEERMQRAYTGAFLAHGGGAVSHVLHLDNKDPALLARKLRRLPHDVIIADVEEWADSIRALPAALRGAGFVSLDVRRSDGPVTGMRQSVERMAACAIDLLMQRRLHNERGTPEEPVSVLTPGAWVEGESLSRAAASLDRDGAGA